jgi:glycosyltransferase involved in cell wall biosynthesis
LRYLMVSTYPPTHCGIGAYGEQSVAQLREHGHVVDVVSPDGQGNVDFAWDLRGGWKLLQLFQLLPYYDHVVIQYHWAFFYLDPFSAANRWDTLKTTLSFILLFLRSRKVEVVAHEIPYLTGRLRALYGWKWKLAPRLVLHTQHERDRFEKHYHLRLEGSRVELRQHHQVFQKFAEYTQTSARQDLGLHSDRAIFLCIGFIQKHKGFHRAIQAFVQADLPVGDLYVVGSLRVADAENQAYLAELRRLAGGHPRVHVVESFISNEEFDAWITASDWVMFPYSEIWSSGVLARTRLLQRPAIISAVGGLSEQAGERDILFTTDEELVSAFLVAALDQPSGIVRSE